MSRRLLPAGAAPLLPGLDAGLPTRRIMLACLNGQRRFRRVPAGPEMERWTRAWARRWFTVEAVSADAARDQVRRYLDACDADVTHGAKAREFGIVEAGRNQPGGPDAFPTRDRLAHRPAPAAGRSRSTRARGPTAGGAHPL